MCGIAGLLRDDPSAPVTRAEIGAMLQPLRHRGPDGYGILLRPGIGLGHRRLAIVDLGGGAQPMANEDSTVFVTFNGEIYNHRDLRELLLTRGHTFRTQSDTEVIVHLYEEFGAAGFARLDGMFAFGLWDARRHRLVLARDRVGIKPLYYGALPHGLAFASELKALLPLPAVARDLDARALRRFFDFLYVPGDATLFRAIRKLPPAHLLIAEAGTVRLERYWDLPTDRPFRGTLDEAAEALRPLLARTVQRHLMADVPVGVLLSGGLDSSLMLALAAPHSPPPVRTFTVGFSDPGLVDERPYARLAAAAYGAEHREVTLDAEEFWSFLPEYAWHCEEPVCEPPAVALQAVARLASESVKVLLSGEGGDEAFAGYPNYVHQLRLAQLERALGPLAAPAAAGATALGDFAGLERLSRYGRALAQPLARHYFSRTASPASYFRHAGAAGFAPAWRGGGDAEQIVAQALQGGRDHDRLAQLLRVDLRTWLPDDLLLKADKMTMRHSVELRVPLLDHHVLEFAARLPAEFKVRGGETKRVLRAAAAPLLPAAILHRPKAGFPVPYAAWLRGPLAERVRETLLARRAQDRGYFAPGAVARLLDEHQRHGTRGREVFALLALEFWHQQFTDRAPATLAAPPPPVLPAIPLLTAR